MRVSVFCCQHKKYSKYDFDCVRYVQVGKALSKSDLGIIGDDTGDNISDKNPYFSELTATYWIWRNCSDDVVGLVHYRRFFNLSDKSHKVVLNFKKLSVLELDCGRISQMMEDCDVILPKQYCFLNKAGKHYEKGWYANDMRIVMRCIKEKYPDIYPYAVECMNKRWGYCFNMLIAKKSLFDEYASFLFGVLFEVEKEIQPELDSRNSYQRRAYGFLAEHLMTIFMTYKRSACGVRIIERQVSNCFENGFSEAFDFFRREVKFGVQDIFGIRRG